MTTIEMNEALRRPYVCRDGGKFRNGFAGKGSTERILGECLSEIVRLSLPT